MSTATPTALARPAFLATVALAILIGGYVGFRWLTAPPTQPNVDEGRAVVDAFLADVQQGKAGQAWDAATAEFKSIEGRESFMRKVKATPLLSEPLQFVSIQDVRVQDSPRSEFHYTSTNSGSNVRVLVGFEAGKWKVDRLTF